MRYSVINGAMRHQRYSISTDTGTHSYRLTYDRGTECLTDTSDLIHSISE